MPDCKIVYKQANSSILLITASAHHSFCNSLPLPHVSCSQLPDLKKNNYLLQEAALLSLHHKLARPRPGRELLRNWKELSTAAIMGVLRGMGASLVAVLVVLSLVTAPGVDASRAWGWGDGGLENGFYQRSCPNVESIIFQSMQASYNADNTVAPGVLRLSYHDCFVRGCDASVLLDGPGLVEKNSSINAGLRGFPAIDAAKEAVESACPGVVSCSDVLQFAARDTVVLTGGQGWEVPAGRRDGRVSKESEVAGNLMTPDKKAPVLLKAFRKKGLDAAQMVALAGAHTIGVASCFKFDDRLHGKQVDPTLPAHFAAELEKKCPVAGIVNTVVSLDLVSPTRFDTQYFKNILNKLGLLTSDQSMLEDSRTAGQVQANTDASTFSSNFASAMVALSKVGVLTGNQGEIRRQCRIVN